MFFELIQVAVGNRTKLDRIPTAEEWENLYQETVRQSLVGLLFSAIEKLNADDASVKPPIELFYQWVGDMIQIEQQNKRLNEAVIQLTKYFADRGKRTCLLKGQGLARLYPRPELRQSGDVDIWVEGNRREILLFLRSNSVRIKDIIVHHVDAEIIEGVATEIHFIPCWTYHPKIFRRLLRFYHENSSRQFEHFDTSVGFAYPDATFNAVYVLSHIYMHYLRAELCMRQIIDYYYLLKTLNVHERQTASNDVVHIGMKKFAGAVVFVLNKVCGGNDVLLDVAPDEKRGKHLLNSIMNGKRTGKDYLSQLRYYPVDIVSIPFWKVGHYVWRKWNGYV